MGKSDKCNGERIRYYRDYHEDLVESRRQNAGLPESYKWLHRNLFYRVCAFFMYAIALIFAFFYSEFVLHIKVVNKKVLKSSGKSGYFLYGNHTQPVGDVFAPARYIFPKRLYTVASEANLGVPVIGKMLPMLGALFIPENMDDMKKFLMAIQYHVKHGRCIIIYPEAHVWPYCGFIRPFEKTSFKFPIMFNAPAYCMTTTYQKRRFGSRPKTTVYIDGPFWPDRNLSEKRAQEKLHDEIYACMKERSRATSYEYIRYVEEI